jgi:nicotinamide phosphoribosyltransferase
MTQYDPIWALDAYKVGHIQQYPANTQYVYSNLTARGSRVEGVNDVVFFGLQKFCMDFLIDDFNNGFFDLPRTTVVDEYQRRLNNLLGPNTVGTDHIGALHDLGYLPLLIRAVPEGTRVPLRVPMLTIENTMPEFFWLTNYFETVLSNSIWMPITSATTAYRFRGLLDYWATRTGGDPGFVPFQGHDFSMRGMSSIDASAMSGGGHLLSFVGTDTNPAIEMLEKFYEGGVSQEMVGVSVSATEHSVMCAGGKSSESETFSRLLDTYPEGILSVVSDTWDLWHVLTDILPSHSSQIMAREGKLVIRPDSGDPADILCGDPSAPAGAPAARGVIRLLWDVFGGTVNSEGYRELDPHVGAIYGDAINYDRADDILSRLAANGYASTNVVLGVGSFTYQFVTRDSFAMAIKATWCQILGEGIDMMKDPVTDDGTKSSATGRLAVLKDDQGELYMVQRATPEQESMSELRTVFLDGEMVSTTSLGDIRKRMGTSPV